MESKVFRLVTFEIIWRFLNFRQKIRVSNMSALEGRLLHGVRDMAHWLGLSYDSEEGPFADDFLKQIRIRPRVSSYD